MSDALVSWLRSTLSEIERVAREATPGPWVVCDDGDARYPLPWVEALEVNVSEAEAWRSNVTRHPDGGTPGGSVSTPANAAHIALHDPQAVLADVAAKRAILAQHAECCDCPGPSRIHGGSCRTLLALASGLRHMPGFRQEWLPKEART